MRRNLLLTTVIILWLAAVAPTTASGVLTEHAAAALCGGAGDCRATGENWNCPDNLSQNFTCSSSCQLTHGDPPEEYVDDPETPWNESFEATCCNDYSIAVEPVVRYLHDGGTLLKYGKKECGNKIICYCLGQPLRCQEQTAYRLKAWDYEKVGP